MDSLMDTLTNVVGILIVILILAQVNAARSVKKIVSDLKPVSEQQLKEKKDALAEAVKALQLEKDKVERRKIAPQATPAQMAEKKLQIAQLEKDIKARSVALLDMEVLQKKLTEQEKLLADRKKEMDTLLAKRDSLLALLQTTPIPTVQQSKVVRIPNSRPVPENANFQRFILAKGKIYHVDHESGIKQIMDDFTRVKRDMEKERIQRAGRPTPIYDQEKLVAYFANRKPNLKDMDAVVMPNRTSTRLYVQFKPKANGGKSIDEIAATNSAYQNLLRSFGGRTIVWFHVMPDSFDLYLKARELSDSRNLSAGWEISGGGAYNETLNEIEVNRLEEPKPAPPGAAPKIAPPKKTLD